jgi:hypothetical protein
MTFHSSVNPLGSYASALEESGLLIGSMREPLWTNRDGTTAPRPSASGASVSITGTQWCGCR